MSTLKEKKEVLQNYIREAWHKSFNEPTGVLKYKFLDPAAVYRGQLWDWDSFFCAIALIDAFSDTAEYLKGCVQNFLVYQRDDGSIPYMICADQYNPMPALPKLGLIERSTDCDINSIKPILAQMATLANSKLNDSKWLAEIYPKLKKHIKHWEDTQQTDKGLFVWRSMRGGGTDNHPALYGRPLNSAAGSDLNSFFYLEYQAMAEIAKLSGDFKGIEDYTKKSENIAKLINECMYDPIDGMYYYLDMLSKKPPTGFVEVTWNIPLKFKMWTGFAPLYAKIAPKDYAKRVIEEHLLNPNEFWSDYGLRSMAKNEPIYNTVESSNPSNWQGPIWVVSTYIMYKSLLNYGYETEAKKVTENIVSTLYDDYKACGEFHEYWNPETGKSNIKQGFMNWNALIGIME